MKNKTSLEISDPNLIIWQILYLILLIIILYFIFKFYNKLMTYLDRKIKYIDKKLEDKN